MITPDSAKWCGSYLDLFFDEGNWKIITGEGTVELNNAGIAELYNFLRHWYMMDGD